MFAPIQTILQKGDPFAPMIAKTVGPFLMIPLNKNNRVHWRANVELSMPQRPFLMEMPYTDNRKLTFSQ